MDEDKPKPKRGGYRSPTAGIPKRVSDGEWERWVATYRQYPGQIVKVAALMQCPRNRASRAWNHGWEKQGRPPIRNLIEADKELARAQRAALSEPDEAEPVTEVVAEVMPSAAELASPEASTQRNMALMLEREKVRRKVQQDSALTRAEEGVLIRRARRNATELADVTSELLTAARSLLPRVRQMLAEESASMSVKDTINFMQKLAVLTKLGSEASLTALQAERLTMGKPIGEGDNVDHHGDKLSPEAALKWLGTGVQLLKKWGVSDGETEGGDPNEAAKEVRAFAAAAAAQQSPDSGAPDGPELAPGIGRSNLN